MTVSINDLDAFIDNIKAEGKTAMNLEDLSRRITLRWGMSDYTINSRIKYMRMHGVIRDAPNLVNVFILVGSERKIHYKDEGEKEAAAEADQLLDNLGGEQDGHARTGKRK